MGSHFSPGLQASPRHLVRKRRELPIRGEILVKVGDAVAATQVVGRAELEGELRIVRAAEQLGITPEELPGALRVSQGQRVSEGDLLAEARGLWGLFRAAVAAPIQGTVELISASTGHVGLRAPPRELELRAYISGTVVAIDEARAVTIEAPATFVQGIFGVGGERVGTLEALRIEASTQVEEGHIPVEARGKVLFGGHSPTAAALARAARAGAVGFVTGSVSGEVLREYLGYDIGIALTGDEQVPMTLIVTEGFGRMAMGDRALRTLRAVNGQGVSIHGATQVRAGALRPEVIAPPSAVIDVTPGAPRGLEVGAPVRIIRVPFFGAEGRVSALPARPQRLDTGAESRVVEVILESGEAITVARANVELLS